AVGGLVSLSGINIPDDRSVGRGVGAQVTVDRSREDDARNRAHRGRLCRAASIASLARARRRSLPHAPAAFETHCEHAATCLWIGNRGLAVGNREASKVGQRDVHVGSIGGRAPLHAAVDAALADPLLPEELATAIGIERVYDT